MKTLLAIILSLTLTAPAWALEFTTSGFATWTFGGIDASRVTNPITTGSILIFNETDGRSETDSPPISLPGVGSGSQWETGTSLTSAANLTSVGTADASATQTFAVFGAPVGASTITVTYAFEEYGTVPIGTLLTGTTSLVLSEAGGRSTGAMLQTVTTGSQSDLSRTITGSFTRPLTDSLGNLTFFQLDLKSNVTAQSVPIPGMLWPTTFLGLAGLGLLWVREWRRVR